MESDNGWIEILIAESRKRHPEITDAVALAISSLLRGKISEQRLSRGEIERIATVLISDMMPDNQGQTDENK